ncbi:hypothetical protein SLEP1_g9008 [Rubroshorea leprosula]|uniref:Uncharacterized protein n=1 Tax=Rubroshorea leprosula TaxID=152421 RepID=A0AAV5IES9_9ROSI|nr:hypothetical protein SLEP1_g9008 [Rubroshorea leprosula]
MEEQCRKWRNSTEDHGEDHGGGYQHRREQKQREENSSRPAQHTHRLPRACFSAFRLHFPDFSNSFQISQTFQISS